MPDTLTTEMPAVLIVDDDPVTVRLLARTVADFASTRFAMDGETALEMIAEEAPDLVLLDAQMPGMSGFEVCRRIKSDERFSNLPVVFVTGLDSAEVEEQGLEIGAADFIAKPIRPAIVAARVRTQLRLKIAMDRLNDLASRDALTGVANRRVFEETLARQWRAAQRGGEPLSLLMIDIDHFKRYNDSYGHVAGDRCLNQVVDALSVCVNRPNDLLARYGGEEFVAILPATDEIGAVQVAERLVHAVDALAIVHAGAARDGHVTISVGVSCYRPPTSGRSGRHAGASEGGADVHWECLVTSADQALYRAKDGGRGRVESAAMAGADQTPAHRAVEGE